MPPTVFIDGTLRFYFFSREEARMHVHVHSPDGEAKFWLDPEICLGAEQGPQCQVVEQGRSIDEIA